MSILQKIAQSFPHALSSKFPALHTIDMHTGGEPLRILVSGGPLLDQPTVLANRRLMEAQYDHIRTRLMYEPRGHADMYGLIPVAPERSDSDFGVLFMHNAGYSTMCGHATLAISKLAAQAEWVNPNRIDGAIREYGLKIDAPCGQLNVRVIRNGDQWQEISFVNVPSFVLDLNLSVDLPEYGPITFDLAYGGAFYAYVDVKQFSQTILPANTDWFIQWGRLMKKAVQEQFAALIHHPFEADLSFLYGVIFREESTEANLHSRNVCIFADGEVDRSPTGSGVSGRAAILSAKNQLEPGQRIEIASILDSRMGVCIEETTTYGPYTAVLPRVDGDAWISGYHSFVIDAQDPWKDGFLLR
ncbi:MAG: proline racemase family protein [Bacteroidota bacterium]